MFVSDSHFFALTGNVRSWRDSRVRMIEWITQRVVVPRNQKVPLSRGSCSSWISQQLSCTNSPAHKYRMSVLCWKATAGDSGKDKHSIRKADILQ